ncbi:MAG TPA: winged helix-turn-helix domain-containing protein [Pyrinomonadaceae bacterium]
MSRQAAPKIFNSSGEFPEKFPKQTVQVKTGPIYEFEDFRLDASERLLLRRGEPVPLHGKSFDLLLTLVRHRGRLLTKEELFELVWPDQIVEESNLTVHMSAIRRALGERASASRLIQTVSGRGYRFTGEVREVTDDGKEGLTIERESLTRIVVEQETEETTPGGEATGIAPTFAARRVGDGRAGELAVLPATPRRARTALTLAALGAVLLLVSAGGVWLYLSRSADEKRRAAGTPHAPHPQLTMRRFTTSGGLPFRVAVSPDGKSLAYHQRIGDKDSLWLGQIEASSSVLIHQQPGVRYEHLAFAPDGAQLYFTMQDTNRPQTFLVRMPILGGATTEVASNVHGPVTFSPDGQRIAFVRRDGKTRQTSIVMANAADGRNESVLAGRVWPESFSGGLSWSPDGQVIAAVFDSPGGPDEILAVSVADGRASKIGKHNWSGLSNVVWLRDGGGLVAVGRELGAARNHQVWLASYPAGEARRITNDLNYYQPESLSLSADGKLAVLQGITVPSIWVAPEGEARRARLVLQGTQTRQDGLQGLAWTPGGRLLYVASVSDSHTVWEMDVDGGNNRQLTPHHANSVAEQARATADGRHVVFQSDRSGTTEVWRANADGGDLRKLTSGGNNSQPALSPDGRWVIYASRREGQQTLWRVSIDGAEAAQLTDQPSSHPQVSPDGKFVAYIGSSYADTSPGQPYRPMEHGDVRLMVMPFEGGESVRSYPVPQTAVLTRGSINWTPDGRAILYRDFGQGLWRQALDEGGPRPVKGFEELRLYNLAWSFDGRNLAYTTGAVLREIVLIENFR